MTDERNPGEAELTRLADGSLPQSRQAELRAQIRESPELTAALAEQQRAVAMLRAVDQPAPDALRSRIDGLTGAGAASRRERHRPRWRRAVILPGLTAVAALVAVLVVVIGAGSGAPTVPQAARLALASATIPAPGVDPAQPKNLKPAGAPIPFPSWGATTGWKPSGARSDTVDGRRITTIYYTSPHGRRIGYAITSGRPLSGAHGIEVVHRYGTRFELARESGARLITWVRSGHTCVIAGRFVTYRTLLALARADE